MRFFAAVFSVVTLVYASRMDINAERYVKYMELLNNCTELNGITVEQYAWATEANNTEGIFDKSKCTEACMFKILKILNVDGTIDMDKALEHLLSGRPGVQRDTMQRNIERCKTSSDDDCDIAHKLMVCALGNY